MNSPKLCPKTGGAMQKTPCRHSNELTASQNAMNKAAAHKAEEESRRRTIILEKKDGSFGFTIQSYGIHFKKEREVEMISYVDSVEFNGAAAKAGLRQGDVILSINGIDVDKADHETLISMIQTCDTRMRMVVLFENCVRKVELQRQALELRKEINDKIEELRQLYSLEHELTKNNMKTHSLPSQKKPSQKSVDMVLLDGSEFEICSQSTKSKKKSSSERKSSKYNQYIDGNTNMFENSTQNNDNNGGNNYLYKNPPGTKEDSDSKHKKTPRPQSRCYPCYQPQNDSNIEAYDLASPCCEPHYFKFYNEKKSSRNNEYKRERKPSKKEKKDSSSQTKRHFDDQFEIPSRSGNYQRYMAIDPEKILNSQVIDTYCIDKWYLENYPELESIYNKKKSSSAHFTTQVFGGYGFGGYGFGSKDNNPDQRGQMKTSKSTNTEHHHGHSSEKHRSHSGHKVKHPTKSTENLLVNAEYQDLNVSNPSVSYDCLSMINSDSGTRTNDHSQPREHERVETNHNVTPRLITHYVMHNSRPNLVLKSFRKKRSNSAEIMRQ